ncbi:MAG: DNA polymerase III subunit gamma/tau [Candidatus Omnitrophica bacterium]|nr:DNA polymerase III subunit gamma/tau [Candidatus Omnitrophota bacterium]
MSDNKIKQTQYIPISRKYRPDNFTGIVGQEHVSQTLKNAIKLNRVAHAYLFAGARGVGKTSMARVFAKALNCPNVKETQPCNKCDVCKEIAAGINLDVLEIDGASNRGIDEMRNLREHVKLKPVTGKYRIYIIDEVHMLTTEAFNALLKTLEEPPMHVKFIFATTAPHKILPTILSRCQRFDFKLIGNDIIVKQLKDIGVSEKINIEDDAILLIAKKANGSMRDAEMILDQIASFTKNKITIADISNMLGVVDQDVLINMSRAIKDNQSNTLLNILNEMICNGKEPFYIVNELIEHFRNMLILAECPDESYVVLNKDSLKQLKALALEFSKEELFYIIKVLQNASEQMNKSSLSKILLEVTLLKIARQKKLLPIEDIMSSIKKLEYIVSRNEKNGFVDAGARNVLQTPQHFKEKEDDILSMKGTFSDEVEDNINDDEKYVIEQKVMSVPNTAPADLFSKVQTLWESIVTEVKRTKVSTGMFLGEGKLFKVEDNNVIVSFSKDNSLHKETLELKSNVDIIEEILTRLVSTPLKIKFAFKEGEAPVIDQKQQRSSTQIDPVVVSAIDKFKGKIVGQYFLQEEA